MCWLDFGQMEGRLRRTLTVKVAAVDGGTQEIRIPITFDFRRFLTISEPMPTWDMRLAAVDKTIDIAVADGFGELASVEKDDRLIPGARVERIDGRHFRLTLSPVATVEKTEFSDVYLHFATPVERMKRYRLPVVLSRP